MAIPLGNRPMDINYNWSIFTLLNREKCNPTAMQEYYNYHIKGEGNPATQNAVDVSLLNFLQRLVFQIAVKHQSNWRTDIAVKQLLLIVQGSAGNLCVIPSNCCAILRLF